MQIRRLDATDPVALAAWYATYRVAEEHGQAYPSPYALEELRAQLLEESPGERIEAYGGYVDGQPVVTGWLELPLMDNRHLAFVDVHTHPDRRRRGHGSAMLEHLSGLAADAGRSLLMAAAVWPFDGPPDGHGHAQVKFLLHRGFRFSLGDVKRSLDLPVDDAHLERLAREAAPYHAGYTLRHFRGPVPDDIIDRFGALVGSLNEEAPSGDVKLEREVFDATRIRADERVFEASGRTKHTTVAVTDDGDVVAYSELVLPGFDPGNVYQWGTLVHPEHRGHRLGMATKVHNLRLFQRDHPGPALLMTYNAEVNRHMIAVNDAMGFRPVERRGEFHKPI